MKSVLKFLHTIPGIGVLTLAILTVPLIAMQFTSEIDWSVSDFILMGLMIFSAGVAYILIVRHANSSLAYKAAAISAIGITLLMLWANAAVGLIGAGPHIGNFMYIGIIAIVIIGTYLSRFSARGMELTMLGAVVGLVALTIIALLANMDEYPNSSMAEIIAVNGFFIVLYSIPALLFRYIAIEQSTNKSKQ